MFKKKIRVILYYFSFTYTMYASFSFSFFFRSSRWFVVLIVFPAVPVDGCCRSIDSQASIFFMLSNYCCSNFCRCICIRLDPDKIGYIFRYYSSKPWKHMDTAKPQYPSKTTTTTTTQQRSHSISENKTIIKTWNVRRVNTHLVQRSHTETYWYQAGSMMIRQRGVWGMRYRRSTASSVLNRNNKHAKHTKTH